MRNFISHEYANIDYDVIWAIFTQHLTPLVEEVEKVKSLLRAHKYDVIDLPYE